MIQWSLSLSHNQIAILSAIRWETDSDAKVVANTYLNIPHFISGIRPLLNEKLVEHTEGERNGYRITQKGRSVLSIIEQEVKDVSSQSIPFLPPAENEKALEGNGRMQLWRQVEEMREQPTESTSINTQEGPYRWRMWVLWKSDLLTNPTKNVYEDFSTCLIKCKRKQSDRTDRWYYPVLEREEWKEEDGEVSDVPATDTE